MKTRRSVRCGGLTAGLSILAAAVQPNVADACSAPVPLAERSVFPSPGASGVPTNARVIVRYRLTTGRYAPEVAFRELADIQIRPAGTSAQMVAVAATVLPVHVRYFERGSTVVLTPEAPLSAHTTYEVLDRFAVPCGGNGLGPDGCRRADHQVFATFTTGAGPDSSTPTFSGDIRVSFGQLRTDNSSCGAGTGGAVRIEWTPAVDDGPLVYTLYRQGSATPPLPYFGATVINGTFLCEGDPSGIGDVELVAGTYEIGAIDLAGNQYRHSFKLRPPYDRCPPAGGAGNATSTADASADTLASSGDRTGAAGCKVAADASATNGALWSAALLALLATALRRRGSPRRAEHR